MPHPTLRCVLVTAMMTLSGCESLGLKLGISQPEIAAVDTVATGTPEPAAAKPIKQPKLQVAVLDPKNFAQTKSDHKQALMRSSGESLSGDDVGYYMDVQKAQLTQELQDATINIEYQDNQVILSLPGADSFGSNSVRLKSGAQELLSSIARVLDEYKKTQITVHGHTDDVGEDAYNQNLSERRALSVAQYLINSGIAKQRIAIVGYGESQPVTTNSTAEGKAQNRRIELHIDPIAK